MLWHLLWYESLGEHVRISLLRALGGLGVGALLGPLIGFTLGSVSPWTRRAAEPLLGLAYKANPVVLFHVVVLFAGIGEVAKIVVIDIGYDVANRVRRDSQARECRLGVEAGGQGVRPVGLAAVLADRPAIGGTRPVCGGSPCGRICVRHARGRRNDGYEFGVGLVCSPKPGELRGVADFAAAALIGGLAFATDCSLRRLEQWCVYWQPIASANSGRSLDAGRANPSLVLPPGPRPEREIRAARLAHHFGAFWLGPWIMLVLTSCHREERDASAAVVTASAGTDACRSATRTRIFESVSHRRAWLHPKQDCRS